MLGLRLAILAILQSADDDLLAIAGVVCSTWITINAGTSARDILCPMGREWYPSVAAANLMVSRWQGFTTGVTLCFPVFRSEHSRTILILFFIQMAGGCWLVEQPISSVIALHDRFQWFLRASKKAGLSAA